MFTSPVLKLHKASSMLHRQNLQLGLSCGTQSTPGTPKAFQCTMLIYYLTNLVKTAEPVHSSTPQAAKVMKEQPCCRQNKMIELGRYLTVHGLPSMRQIQSSLQLVEC